MRKTKIDWKDIDRIFEEAETTSEAVVEVYRIAIPEYDQVKFIDGFPAVNRADGEKLFQRFIDLGKKQGDGFPGGLWINNGFSSTPDLPAGYIYVDPSILVMES